MRNMIELQRGVRRVPSEIRVFEIAVSCAGWPALWVPFRVPPPPGRGGLPFRRWGVFLRVPSVKEHEALAVLRNLSLPELSDDARGGLSVARPPHM